MWLAFPNLRWLTNMSFYSSFSREKKTQIAFKKVPLNRSKACKNAKITLKFKPTRKFNKAPSTNFGVKTYNTNCNYIRNWCSQHPNFNTQKVVALTPRWRVPKYFGVSNTSSKSFINLIPDRNKRPPFIVSLHLFSSTKGHDFTFLFL